MDALIRLCAEYGALVVFATVLIEQLGVPLPAYPVLVLAGSLVAHGKLSLPTQVAAAVAASLIADSLWYLAGQRFGSRVLGGLCRISLSPDSCIRQTESIFSRWGAPSLLFAKFVPGFASVSTVLAGAMRIRRGSFLFFDVLGAALWAGVGLGIGLVFADAISDVTRVLDRLGHWALGLLGLAVAVWLLRKWWRRYQFSRQLRMDRMHVNELSVLIDSGKRPLILDTRSEFRLSEGRIPGALTFGREREWPQELSDHDREALVVVYCSCPNDASAVVEARRLLDRGFKKVRPLAGGIDAWVAAGRQLAF
jgi:membrane protein DedA with SNARE-associated domain/rhodanese-related sulfurtransferase